MEEGLSMMRRTVALAVLTALLGAVVSLVRPVSAAILPCADVHTIWARGSGVDIGDDDPLERFSGDLTKRIDGSLTANFYSLGQDGGYGGHAYPAVEAFWRGSAEH